MPRLYRIRRGDNLTKIARRYGMTWEELYNYKGGTEKQNHERLRSDNPNLIFPREEIMVPDEADQPQPSPSPAPTPSPTPSPSPSPAPTPSPTPSPGPPTTGGGAVGAPSSACPAEVQGALIVTVTRSNDGRTLGGASVTIDGPEPPPPGTPNPLPQTRSTLGSGSVTFGSICPGSYEIAGRKVNYTSDSTIQAIAPAATETAYLVLTATTSLIVTVVADRAGETSQPVMGATVRISGPETHERQTYAPSGHAWFLAIAPGEYSVSVTHPDHRMRDPGAPPTVTVTEMVTEGSHSRITVHMVAAGVIKGRVADAATNAQISGATVTLTRPGQRPVTTSTDGTGHFSQGELIIGQSYTVSASKPGYTDQGAGHVTATAAQSTGATPITLRLQALTLEITDGAGTVLTGQQTVIVGERIDLQVRTQPAGQALNGIQWSIPDPHVQGYTQSKPKGEVQRLTNTDLTGQSIRFHWASGDNHRDKIVQVSATAAGGGRITASVPFRILQPSAVSFTSVTSSVNIGPVYWAGGQWLGFINWAPGVQQVGIRWTGRMTAPPGGAGQFGAIQLIKIYRSRVRSNGDVERITTHDDPEIAHRRYLVDDWFNPDPMPWFYRGMGHIVHIAAGATGTWREDDSPSSQIVANDTRVRGNDYFKTYLMYKADTPNSIWVTLSVLRWNWRGEARKGAAGAWALVPGSFGNAANPAGSPSWELPKWTGYVTSRF